MRKNAFSLNYLMVLAGFLFFFANQALAQNKCAKSHRPLAKSASTLHLQNYVQNYGHIIPPVQDMITLALERYSGKRPTGHCYRAVKGLLLDSGLIRKAVDGTFASSAHTKNFLVERGFINLLTKAPFSEKIKGALDPEIPVGALLVYEGTNGVDGTLRPLGRGIGHIEIKCGENCYVFDTINSFPGGYNGGSIRETGKFDGGEGLHHRRLIGVYILDYFLLF